ncbi:MAG: NUDIX domain-containing protein [Treponema sp.]|nr:NUDIX domain-containing protein [Treponema sp.]
MKKSIACIVYDDGKILIAHRNPVGDMGGRWEFPGGKVEPGEDEKDSIAREMMEEFGVVAEAKEKISSIQFEHRGEIFTLDAYLVVFEHNGMEKSFTLSEHTEYKWINASSVPDYEFVDSDLKIYPSVLEFLSAL